MRQLPFFLFIIQHNKINKEQTFSTCKRKKLAELKSEYVNSSEYKYLIDASQGSSITTKFIKRVEDYKRSVDNSNYDIGNKTEKSIYKNLIIEYLNGVINENHDASVKRLN